jgi:hypothetical protein
MQFRNDLLGVRSPLSLLLLTTALLATGTAFWSGCEEQGSGMARGGPAAVQYELDARPNDGAFPLGRSGAVTFYDLRGESTLVKLDLAASLNRRPEPGPPEVSFSASIIGNGTSKGGREFLLSPIDPRTTALESARLISEPLETFLELDRHVRVWESIADSTVISEGDIGANATGITSESGLDLVPEPRSLTFDLSATPNAGDLAPEGIAGSVRFRELTGRKTLVTVMLAPETASGRTGADVSHPAHLHVNSVSEGGEIAFALSPISGDDAAARSSTVIREPFRVLADFDGHVDVHQSNANRRFVLARGNIGANEPDSEDQEEGRAR